MLRFVADVQSGQQPGTEPLRVAARIPRPSSATTVTGFRSEPLGAAWTSASVQGSGLFIDGHRAEAPFLER